MLLMNAVPRRAANRSRSTRAAAWAFALSTRLAAPVLGFVLASAPASASAAEPAAKKVLAVHVEGQDADAVREAIEATLPDRIVVAPTKEFAAALKKAGQSKPLGAAMTNPKQRDRLVPRVQQAASIIDAGAVLVGIVQKVRGEKRVHLVWVNAEDDATPVDEAVSLKGSEDEQKKAIAKAITNAVETYAPAPPPEPEETTPPPPDETKPKEEAPSGRVRHQAGSSIVSAEVGFELGGRVFTYSDGISGNLRRYDVYAAPVAAVQVEVFPAAMTTIPVLRDLGISAGYARAFGLQSATEGGDPVDTVYQRITAALKYRIPLSRPTGPVIGVLGGVRWQTFQIDAPGALSNQVASVDYLAIRAGVDGWIPIGPVAAILGFEWLEPLTTGAVYDRFSGPKVHGITAAAGLAVRFESGLQIRLTGHYDRFFSDFDPVLGDAYVAGGALDQYFGVRLGLAYMD
ncbi:hypothetical protein [Polyangium jinanense]|uniref:Uncharacterized protein n=1 Tax=Polyangium jinanense TaxID=2829994 RepID=A0A9X4ATY5_9BACT|nr:hypothetical protein [Polyangium jinanense]MDC3960890.1 hypothetical protein [Polyangium jinanense]MDC3984713.1 hypothetical protein [Polyangium jinanense]